MSSIGGVCFRVQLGNQSLKNLKLGDAHSGYEENIDWRGAAARARVGIINIVLDGEADSFGNLQI